VFVNFLLTDEINRAPAKVQSALLEVMAEQQVSIGGTTYPVPTPFVVMATQNPIESDGVYQLPDAQRDRFLMKVTLGYPDHAEEISIVERMAVSEPEPRQIIDLAQLVELQRKCDEVLVDRSVLRYAVDLVHATRDPEAHQLADLAPLLAIGASPRATLGLIRAAKALAAMRGRSYASPRDVFEVAPEILRHRLVLTYDALAREVSVEHVLQRLMATVPAAWVHPGRAQSLPDPGIAH
jgi:MoxR-like ATPase